MRHRLRADSAYVVLPLLIGCDGSRPSEPEPLNNQIVFVSDRLGFGVFRPFAMNPEGGAVAEIPVPRGEVVDDPDVAPDGLRIVYRQAGDIWSVRIDGKEQRNLTATASAFETDPAWSHDGERIAFVTRRDGNAEIYVMKADGSEQRNLTNHPGEDLHPSWSPDDSQLVFATTRDGNGRLYVVNVDGTGSQPLTDAAGDDGAPEWSPDGRRVAFLSGRSGGNHLYLLDLDGGHLQLIPTPGYGVFDVTWSSDGERLALGCTGNKASICVIGRSGDGLTEVTGNSGSLELTPSWSP